MATVLLIFIYVIYIGLGLPDSVIGAAWTSISAELSIPIGYESFITVLIAACTSTASFFSARIINKLGPGIVTAVSTLLTAVALLLFSFSNTLLALCLCAIPAGLGAGAIDAAINNYASVHYSSALVNFLHCFYGIGVTLSPYVFSFALKNSSWRAGYRTVFIIQAGITVIAFIALIFWKGARKTEQINGEPIQPVTLKYKQLLKNKTIRISYLVFFATCSLEFTCDYWGASFIEKTAFATADVAARCVTLYFIGMTLGRFLAGVLSTKISNRAVIFTGYASIAVGIIILFLPVGYTVKGVGLAFIGLGNGPTFPNLSILSPRIFGVKYSQSVISSQMVVSNVAILIVPALFGVIAQNLSLKAFPPFVLILFAVMVVFTIIYFRLADKPENTKFE